MWEVYSVNWQVCCWLKIQSMKLQGFPMTPRSYWTISHYFEKGILFQVGNPVVKWHLTEFQDRCCMSTLTISHDVIGIIRILGISIPSILTKITRVGKDSNV